MSLSLASKPTLIEWKNLRFLIMDSPKQSNLPLYLKECEKHHVTQLVRISEPYYDKEDVEKSGISLHEMCFDDGASPPQEIIDRWITLVRQTFDIKKKKSSGDGEIPPCIAIHCVAGLGRAPVMVAIALVEHGMESMQAVTFIRERRRGAINAVQLAYLESYNPRGGGRCSVM